MKTLSQRYNEVCEKLNAVGNAVLIKEGDYAGYTGNDVHSSCSNNATQTDGVGEYESEKWIEAFLATASMEFDIR